MSSDSGAAHGPVGNYSMNHLTQGPVPVFLPVEIDSPRTGTSGVRLYGLDGDPGALPVGLPVAEDLALVIAQHDFLVVGFDDVLGQERDFSAASRRIDDEMRHRQSGGPAAQGFDDLQAFLEPRAKVLRAENHIGLVDVIRTYTGPQQFLHQLLHYLGRVVDALEQHGLVAERDSRVSQHTERLEGFRRQFVGMIEMHIHKQRMVFFKNCDQFRGDALRQKARDAAADA